MNWLQVITELGGAGALVSAFTNMQQQYRQSVLDARKFERDEARKDAAIENEGILKKFKAVDGSEVGAWVHRIMVCVACAVISSTVWAPLISILPGVDATVACIWYWPTEGSFLFFEWNKLKPFTFGPQGADIVIGILPIHIAMMSNIMSHYFVNRVYKRKI